MKTRKASAGLIISFVFFGTWDFTAWAGVPAGAVKRTSHELYRELTAGLELYGNTHVYPGPRMVDDFFCFNPSDCRSLPGEPDPVNPVMDHLAELSDKFIVRTFQETLGSEQNEFAGFTLKGEPCVADLRSMRIDAEIDGDLYSDYFRLDWNEDGAWHRFQIRNITPHSLKMISQPDLLTRAVQRLFSPRQSGQQKFEIARSGPERLRVSLWVNHSQPEHVLDWRRKKVVCEF
jgi:hypothetical protein